MTWAYFSAHLPGRRCARGLVEAGRAPLLLVDEASMMPSPELADLIGHTQARGGKVILAGDTSQLQAVEDGGGSDWILDGQKRFITNAPMADLFIVFARTREPAPGIAVYLVPAATPGVTVGPKDAKMGQEGAWTADVIFDSVRVQKSALVGGAEEIGYRAAMTSLARGRIHIAALAVGCAQRALDESVAYAAANTQGGTPIGNFQLAQAMLAGQFTGVAAGRALVREAAAAYDSGDDRRITPSAAKLFRTEMAGGQPLALQPLVNSSPGRRTPTQLAGRAATHRGGLGKVQVDVGPMVTHAVHGPGKQLLVKRRAGARRLIHIWDPSWRRIPSRVTFRPARTAAARGTRAPRRRGPAGSQFR